MGTIEGRNSMILRETEDIKKRQQEYTQELQKTHLNDPDRHNGVITHLDPDILECEVKWALGNITTNKPPSGSDGIPDKLFKILKMMQLKCCIQPVSKFEKLSSDHRTGKVSFHFNPKER